MWHFFSFICRKAESNTHVMSFKIALVLIRDLFFKPTIDLELLLIFLMNLSFLDSTLSDFYAFIFNKLFCNKSAMDSSITKLFELSLFIFSIISLTSILGSSSSENDETTESDFFSSNSSNSSISNVEFLFSAIPLNWDYDYFVVKNELLIPLLFFSSASDLLLLFLYCTWILDRLLYISPFPLPDIIILALLKIEGRLPFLTLPSVSQVCIFPFLLFLFISL